MTPDPLSSVEIFRSYIAPALAPLIVAIGWVVVSRDNDRRETRKEIRSLINELIKRAEKLTDEAQYYFCELKNSTDDARSAEIKIKQGLERLDSLLQVLVKMEKRFDQASTSVGKFMDVITGHEKFESRSYTRKFSIDHVDVMKIALAQADLFNVLETIYIDTQIKRPWPYPPDD
ncbi:hypothetical protein [Paracandidimonas lactea]|uniref:hypothetical protein n=1 Tax=Paracandidimonas lactea TaxID=2895524 RepID=UPI001F1D1CCE|nr:hypothetical protein [Paracandidimonas lactea]